MSAVRLRMKARVDSLFVEERMMECWLVIGQRGRVHSCSTAHGRNMW